MKDMFEKLAAQENLTEAEITAVAEKIFKGQLSEAQIAAFLMALKIKGETPEEILGLVKTIKKNAAVIPSQTSNAMDIVVQVVISPFLSIFQRLVALSSLLVASKLLSMVIVLFLQNQVQPMSLKNWESMLS